MALKPSPRLAAALICAVLSGCAVSSSRDGGDLDVSQLVRTEPADLRLVDVLPRGLGPGGQAIVVVDVRDENPEVATTQSFELGLADTSYQAEERRSVATYVLAGKDYDRWRQVQIRLRAQMLAGYADVGVDANSTVCDEAGVALATGDPGKSPLMMQNAATGRTILKVTAGEPLTGIKERVPFCT
jgi:hypothetical protein